MPPTRNRDSDSFSPCVGGDMIGGGFRNTAVPGRQSWGHQGGGNPVHPGQLGPPQWLPAPKPDPDEEQPSLKAPPPAPPAGLC
eukprot:gene4657-4850_t